MKAMILAAGLGKRMRPLTDNLPKPLLPVAGATLIEYQIERLAAAGITEVVINVSYLAGKIRAHLGDGSRYGVVISYSEESIPLETAGAIHRALALLGTEPFLLVNSDVWCEFALRDLCQLSLKSEQLGHLLMVPNPEFKVRGDFQIDAQGFLLLCVGTTVGVTFAGISVIRPELIATYPKKREVFALKEVFDWALAQRALTAELYSGEWRDIGTPERLQELQLSVGTGQT
tara:strand:- start:659 stop:1351 length:693 start_codon:yes stop_codon:yes gene_type:complete